MEENPFKDLIQLNENIDKLEVLRKDIQYRADILEKRKHDIFNLVSKLEDNSVAIPEVIMDLSEALIQEVNKRKEIFKKWQDLDKQKNKINGYAESFEKRFLSAPSQLGIKQRNTIEVMLAQYEQIISKQEALLIARELILAEENRLINEIDIVLRMN